MRGRFTAELTIITSPTFSSVSSPTRDPRRMTGTVEQDRSRIC